LAISVGEPEGFADLTEEQTAAGRCLLRRCPPGAKPNQRHPGSIRFTDPAAVVALLPNLSDRAGVEAALAGRQPPANAQLACSATSDPSRMWTAQPRGGRVIFDRDHFRLEIFLNPRFLAVQENVEEAYIPSASGPGDDQPGRRGGFGDFGTPETFYNFQDSIVLASGERRLRAELNYANELGFGAERVALEWDRPGLRYSAARCWRRAARSPGGASCSGWASRARSTPGSTATRCSAARSVVYLDQRARVDVVRDGRVLYSAIYEAGNQEIDTSSLPDGSYDIVLRIDEPGRRRARSGASSRRAGGSRRWADRLLRLRRGAGRGRRPRLARAFGPSLSPGRRRPPREPELGAVGWLRGQRSRRLGRDRRHLHHPLALVRAAAVADDDGTYGGILQLMSAGTSRLSFNFDLRRIEADSDLAVPPPPAAGFGTIGIAASQGSYSQANGVISYSLANVRFMGSFAYRDDESDRARYSIGPSVEWDVLRKGPYTLTLRGDATATERGNAGFAGIVLRVTGGHSTMTALGGGRASNLSDDELGEGPVAALSGSLSRDLAGGELSLGGGYEHQPRQDNLVLSTEYRHELGTLAGDIVRSDTPGETATQYSLGFQTTFAAGAGALEVAGKTTTESLIVARVDGARDNDRFEVLINEQLAGTIVGAAPFPIALPAYRAYDVRIRPTGEDLLAYDNSPRHIGLYPGTVARLEWTAAPVTIKFGRLVAPDGTPVRGASITGKGVWSETDDNGYFQIEAPDGVKLTVTTRDGRSFAAELPAGARGADIARIGEVVCCGEGDGTSASARWTWPRRAMTRTPNDHAKASFSRAGAGDGRGPRRGRARRDGPQPGDRRPAPGQAAARGHRSVERRRRAHVRAGRAVRNPRRRHARRAARTGHRPRAGGAAGLAAQAGARARREARHPHCRDRRAAGVGPRLPGDDQAGRGHGDRRGQRAEGVRRLRHAGAGAARADHRRSRGPARRPHADAAQHRQQRTGAVRRAPVRCRRRRLPRAAGAAAVPGGELGGAAAVRHPGQLPRLDRPDSPQPRVLSRAQRRRITGVVRSISHEPIRT
jgi:hypothetical protein